MKKRILSLLLAASTLALGACGAQPASSARSGASASAGDGSLYHLRIAYSPSLCQAPLHIAVEKGFFEDEGIDAENIQLDAAHVQEAIGADQVDAGFGLVGKFLQPLENGLPIKFTAGIHTGCVKIVAPKDSGIQTVAELKGKRIGVSGLAGAETIVAKRALSAEGIRVDEKNPEVEFVVFSKNDLRQALENGSIDVISYSDPIVSQFAEQYDLNTILDTATSEGFDKEYCCASFVSSKLAAGHPEVAAAFTRAVLKASVWVQQHTEDAAQIQLDKKYVTGDLAFNTKLLQSYNYLPSVQGGYDAIKLSVGQLAEIGVLKAGTDAEKFADNCYLFFDDVPDTYTAEEIGAGSDSNETPAAPSQTASPASVPAAGGEEDCCSAGSTVPVPIGKA